MVSGHAPPAATRAGAYARAREPIIAFALTWARKYCSSVINLHNDISRVSRARPELAGARRAAAN